MRRLTNSLLVLGIAFGPLFFAAPAHADTIQFTYYWTSREFTFTDQVVSVTVTNDITNKIGGNGEVIDTYRITLGTQVIEVTEKHGPLVYTFDIVGTQTLKLEGIDRGFWGGFYGPIMTVEVLQTTQQPEPVTESPSVSPEVSESPSVSPEVSESPTVPPVTDSPTQSMIWDYVVDENGILTAQAPTGQVFSDVVARYVAHDSDCGLDVSDIVGAVLIGSSSGTIPADNGSFGDPCPGWYKKLVVSVQYSTLMLPASESPQVTQSATLSPEPEVQPTPTPTPEPAPSPAPVQPEPTPTVEPSPEPTASSPTESPAPTESPSPTHSPVVETPTESLPVEVPPLPATSSPASPILPSVFPSPEQSIEEPSETPSITASETSEVAEETQSDSVSGAIETAVTEAIGAAVEAVGQLVEAFASAGLDMTPAQREEAQDVVISTIIVSQVASTASAAAVSARKIK